MRNYDYEKHVKGESQFVDDQIAPAGLLHIKVFGSTIAHGKIISEDYSEALKSEGVAGIITAKDIPGENQIGGIIQDEPLLADGEVHFAGQPIALIIADTFLNAKEASAKIKIEYKKLPVITDPREAFAKGELIMPPRIFSCGDLETTWPNCKYIVEGIAESGGQEHLYLETQGAYAYPVETGGVKVISSTQGPTQVQRAAAKVLGLPMNKVEVDVLRVGGGFGGKEDQATTWGCLAALAAFKLKRPVKLILPRQDDMRMTGKRHPYSSDFKIGLSKEGKILAYEVTFYQNSGAASDLSPAILDRTLFHAVNSYYVPNVKATGIACRTNLPPNTAFRGFGGPQGMFVMEAAIYKAAAVMGMEVEKLQEINLMKEGDEFHYGQKIEKSTIQTCWNKTVNKYDVSTIKKRSYDFNLKNKLYKKGFALMPVCFGISFTNTFMNQASALVHVYSDGSISVSTGAVEMGQGVNMKIRQTVASVFSVSIDRVKIETTNTSRAANTSPTAASSGADMNGRAAEIASKDIFARLKKVAADKLKVDDVSLITFQDEFVYLKGKKEFGWNELVQTAFFTRVNLSSHANYAVPGIYFDRVTNKGNAFAYYAIGSAVIEVTLDCLRGLYEIDSVKIVHDYGKSLNYVVDRGQTEGALMQGLGWITIEEVIYNKEGQLLTNALSTYKVPDIHFAPKEIEIEFLETVENSAGLKGSKAIGEPPLMYGIGAFFAIMNAMKAFDPDKEYKLSAPITPEKVLLELYTEKKTVSV
jgi:xanthine dehydrogenase large subunit